MSRVEEKKEKGFAEERKIKKQNRRDNDLDVRLR